MNLTWICKTEPGVAIVNRSYWKIPFLNMCSTFERYMDITMGVVKYLSILMDTIICTEIL